MESKTSTRDFPYYLGVILTVFYCIVLYSSYIREFFSEFIIAALLISIMGLFFCAICLSKWPIKVLFPLVVVMIIVLVCWQTIEKNILLLYFFMIFASYKKSFKKIQKIIAYYTIVFSFLVVFCSLIGVVPNDVYVHGADVAYSMGFFYYSSLSYNIFFSTVLLLGLNRKCNKRGQRYVNVFIFLLVNYSIYKITTTRLTLTVTLITAFLYLYIYRHKEFVPKRRIMVLAWLAFPISAFINYLVAVYYTPANKLMLMMNTALRSRLVLAQQGIEKYGVTLFGSQLENINGIINGYQIYFYIDNGYINTLLSYGIILFAIVIIAYSSVTIYAIRNNEKTLLLLCAVTCLFCYVNNVLMSFALNPVLLMAPNIATNLVENKQRRPGYGGRKHKEEYSS